MQATILEAQELVKYYGKDNNPCLNGVSMGILQGEKFGIFGPNGAGKTTLMSIFCYLLEASSGKVTYFFDGKEKLADEVLPRLGYVPQDFAFYPELSPEDNLFFFGSMYGIPNAALQDRVTFLLDRVGLLQVRKQAVRTFSGGMKRRVNLAIGLINKPEILFLDEPTVGVDVQSRHAILDLLNELHAEGTTIVYTSHHLKEAQDFCDRIALLDNGVIIAMGPTSELLMSNECGELEELFVELTGTKLRD